MRRALPQDYSLGIATLHADGSLTLANGMRVENCNMSDLEFNGGVLNIRSEDGQTVVEIDLAEGGHARYEFRGTGWYEILPDEPAAMEHTAPSEARPLGRSWKWVKEHRGVLLAGGASTVLLLLICSWWLKRTEIETKERISKSVEAALLKQKLAAGEETAEETAKKLEQQRQQMQDKNRNYPGWDSPGTKKREAESSVGPEKKALGKLDDVSAFKEFNDLFGGFSEGTKRLRHYEAFFRTAGILSRQDFRFDGELEEQEGFAIVRRSITAEETILDIQHGLYDDISSMYRSNDEIIDFIVGDRELREAYGEITSEISKPNPSLLAKGYRASASGDFANVRSRMLRGGLTGGDLFLMLHRMRELLVLMQENMKMQWKLEMVLQSLPQNETWAKIIRSGIKVAAQVAAKEANWHPVFDLDVPPPPRRWDPAKAQTLRKQLRQDALQIEQALQPELGDYMWSEKLEEAWTKSLPKRPARRRIVKKESETREASEGAEGGGLSQEQKEKFDKYWKSLIEKTN